MARIDSVSQFSADKIGIAVVEVNVPTDADTNDVRLDVVRDSDMTMLVTNALATHDIADGVAGFYSYTLGVDVTSTKGSYTAIWTWQVGSADREFTYHFAVVDPQPFFDSLDSDQKQLVDNVYHSVADAFDSTVGGPYLWEMPQSMFGFETVARILVVDAMTTIN